MLMLLYSAALALGLLVSAPWWLLRMATTQRYREGLGQRLGAVPAALQAAVAGQRVLWVHAVSVGEVLAATRLVAELEAALGPGWIIAVSTTTRTGQALARQRFGAARVFYMPLDFAFAVRAYLRALRPAALILMESELWPRTLHECRRAAVPVAVANARVSDRSFARALKLRVLWSPVLRQVSLWLAQSDEDARRLTAMGAAAAAVHSIGNLKYDVRAPQQSRVAELIREAAAGRPIVVAGSTVAGSTVDRPSEDQLSEDEMVIQAWEGPLRRELQALLVLAPRHPERFAAAEAATMEFPCAKASAWLSADQGTPTTAVDVVLLDTIGDLAAVYGIADIAFVGGSLVDRGGHNPLEPAQFGVPVLMGPSFHNFRDIIAKLQAARAICLVRDHDELAAVMLGMLHDRAAARAMGQRGRQVFEQEQGATARAVAAVVGLLAEPAAAEGAPS